MQNEKFASEIFLGSRWRCEDVALHNILGEWYRVPVKPMTHQWVLLVPMHVGDRPGRFGGFQIK
jgi:hypothetical protein